MTIHSRQPTRLFTQQRLHVARMPVLHGRIGALAARLSAPRPPCRGGAGRRAPERFTPIERVLRRCTVRAGDFTAHLSVQAVLRAGDTRLTQRITVSRPQVRGPAMVAPHRPTAAVIQRIVSRERLSRHPTTAAVVSATPAAGATSRGAMATRVARPGVVPRAPMTMLRTQPAAAAAAAATARTASWEPGPARVAPRAAAVTASAPALPLQPQELSRLTEHVIRQLDHRVLSFQERSGRV